MKLLKQYIGSFAKFAPRLLLKKIRRVIES